MLLIENDDGWCSKIYFVTQDFNKIYKEEPAFGLGRNGQFSRFGLKTVKNSLWLGFTQMLTDLITFRKAEAVDATPQDLSTVLRWAGGMRFLAGPATLD